MIDMDDREFQLFLQKLTRLGKLNCAYYRDNYLKRRVQYRMSMTNAASYADYYRLLETSAGEYEQLIDAIGTNVTEFFRDREVYDYLRKTVIPHLSAGGGPWDRAMIKVWSTCCSTGQEPYSLAISFLEVIGEALGRMRVRIHATDIDTEALSRAKAAVYKQDEVAKIDRRIADKYFEPAEGGMLRVRQRIRDMVEFSPIELISGKVPQNNNMIVCRNMLIYIRHEHQPHLFNKFYEALRPGGYLVLGKTERLPDGFGERFEMISPENKIYIRK
jgi:chemotaxis methyl-accepting protein methylase